MAQAENTARLVTPTDATPVAREPTERLRLVVEMVRELSLQTDPQELVNFYRERSLRLFGRDSSVSLSRRGLERPYYRLTRASRWKEDINPWTQKDRLPLLQGGLLGDLVYGDAPRVLRDISVSSDDPAYEYLQDAKSLAALPLYDEGVALNMVVRLSADPSFFDDLSLADAVLETNLFGRATSSLVHARRLHEAYAELDYEMRRVAEIQRALLPPRLPDIETLDIAVSYETAQRAGGDYYDFFDLQDGRWGILIADVSGHGTPAAVVMAILRTMLHGQCHQCSTPREVLQIANRRLHDHADQQDGTFVTAFYGVYDPRDKSLHYACAGHHPPLLVNRHARVRELDDAQSLPLGVEVKAEFAESDTRLESGDTLLLYTDGITEARNQAGEPYGNQRLLGCVSQDVPHAQHIIDCVVHKLIGFTSGQRPHDDQTLVALRVK